MIRARPAKKFEEIRIGGKITEIKEKEFSFEIYRKERELRNRLKQLEPRTQTVSSNEDNYFQNPKNKTANIRAVYLNKESEEGLYKDEQNNLPYEIWGTEGFLLYRQSIKEKKEDIFNRLEKLAVEEGLRK